MVQDSLFVLHPIMCLPRHPVGGELYMYLFLTTILFDIQSVMIMERCEMNNSLLMFCLIINHSSSNVIFTNLTAKNGQLFCTTGTDVISYLLYKIQNILFIYMNFTHRVQILYDKLTYTRLQRKYIV